MKSAFLTVLIGSVVALAQPDNPSKPAEITQMDGAVYLNGQRIQPSTCVFPKLVENSLIRTENGRADIQLVPGAVLRLGQKSSFRLVTNGPSDTRIELLTGSAVALTDATARDTNPWDRRLAGKVTIMCEDTVTLSNFGA